MSLVFVVFVFVMVPFFLPPFFFLVMLFFVVFVFLVVVVVMMMVVVIVMFMISAVAPILMPIVAFVVPADGITPIQSASDYYKKSKKTVFF